MSANVLNSQDLILKDECFMIVGLAMKIHNKLGRGFKEIVYKDALELELQKNNIPYTREHSFNIRYEDVILRHSFIADYFVFNAIILEVKSTSFIQAEAFRQTLNYLKASQIQLGIILNFGSERLDFKRVVCTY